MGESPVRVEVLTQLQHHGIPPEQITYPRVALSAPWRLCVRHGPPQDPAGARVTLLDLREPHSPATHSWPLHQAQGALAHPSQPLLALREGPGGGADPAALAGGGRLSQVIEAQAVGLPRHSFSRNPHPSSALLAAVRHGTGRNGQFHVVELGPHQPGNAALLSARANLAFKGAQPGDFPSAVQFAPQLGLALVLTKHALLFLADVETAQPLHRVQLAWDIVFATVPDPPRHGLVGVCRSGKVLSVSLCPDPLLQLLSHRPASLYLTQRLLQLVRRAPDLCKVSPPAEPAMPRGQPRLQAGERMLAGEGRGALSIA
ncbi:clathrin heavy chain-like isoform X8 [Dermochelys coriacea]|uniref:clathrin heavy chain-like isoform X8 n=1 Tax=Dermochelys coriacea TaxID=27794 RepID=UPI001CA8827C|nr:clathrin heavy chain-like isoform X8 [Dermochelys coriacea]